MKRGPEPYKVDDKICENCGIAFNRKQFLSKKEDVRQFKNRRYCSRKCSDEGRRKVYKEYYERHKDEIRDRKKRQMKLLRLKNPEKYNAQSRATKRRERELLFSMYGEICP
jgi:hypothetical protein